jgi:anti-sigma factor (TIGR02949 family)
MIMSTNEINCEQALKQIFEFIDHELLEDERERLERHLQSCRTCFSRVEFERRLKAKLSGLSDNQAPDKTRERIKSLIEDF